jgi:adenylate cyclase class 2
VTIKNNKEIEIKLPVVDIPELISKITSLGFGRIQKKLYEYNIVFDTPEGNLKKKNQLLRLRKIGDMSFITFKQPLPLNQGINQYKIREETEISVSEFTKTQSILLSLGYHVFFIYEKYRETYRHDDIMIMIDQTPIGDYIEIEGKPEDIDLISGKLGFKKNQYIIESYYSLFRQQKPRGHMLFK